jgi:hypothetical protein
MDVDISDPALVCRGLQVGGLVHITRLFADCAEWICPLAGQVLLIAYLTCVFCYAEQFWLRRMRLQCQVGQEDALLGPTK